MSDHDRNRRPNRVHTLSNREVFKAAYCGNRIEAAAVDFQEALITRSIRV